MNKNKNLTTHYLLILDCSGSMNSIRQKILSAINEQIEQIRILQLKFPEQTFVVSLITFNTNTQYILRDIPALELIPLDHHEYVPQGMTALWDAIGMGITGLKVRYGDEIDNNKASAIANVFTDGYENASKEYTHSSIRNLISELDEHPNWTFSYVGSTPDAVETAISIGIRIDNAMSIHNHQMDREARRHSGRLDHYAAMKQESRVEKDFLRQQDFENNEEE